METETKPTPAPKAAGKPATKPDDGQITTGGIVKPTPAISPLSAFQALLDKAPKEHLPTMMVRIANKCLAEKVFASPGAMSEAIVGASKK